MAIDLDVHGNTQPLEAAVQAAVNRIRRKPIKVTVDDKGATQPLGNMKRAADEFSKSMEAANARILAFGASMAIINGVADAFKGMVRNLVDVEKSLADINVVMGLTSQNLDKFSDGLFKVAKETGAAFRVAADAATEYARQGLAVEETLKRTRDALILTRLTGMDSAEAVKSLTAAMNTYGKQIKDTTQLVSKFAAVDVQFAVSAEDFAAAISRTGQAAKSAGVDIDELIGIVTSAQQQTARGGAVIGNALKTIFTKTGRTDTLNQLENLGIAVRDLEGNTIGAKRILTDLANSFDHLSEAQKAQITQTMGGLFHINILKAVLSDAAKQNGILAKATQISSSATDEAIQKNEQLRNTMAAMAGETGNAIKELSVQIGELMLAPGMEKILNTVKSIAEGASDILGDGESVGGKFANGFLKGVGNVITGPGLVVLTTVFVKLFMTAAKFTGESLKSLIGVTNEAQKQKAIQTSLVTLIGQNAALGKEMLRTDISRTEKEKILLGLLQMQTAEANKLNAISKQLASTLYTRGYGPGLTTGKRRASGHIPNFANPERSQAAQGGYAAGSIRSMNMPGEGPVIYNSAETVKNFAGFKQPAIMPPQSSKAGKNYQQAFGDIHGFDPYAAGGYIPNYAGISALSPTGSKMGDYRLLLTKGSERKGQFQKGFGSLTKEEANLALRRSRNKKTTASTTSQLKDAGQIYNKSGKMVLFAASTQGGGSYTGDRKKNIIYLNPNTSKGDNKFSNTAKTGMEAVNVPYFTIGRNDKEREANDPKIKNKIQGDLINQAQKTTDELVGSLFKVPSIPSVIKSSDVAVASGKIFEKIIMSVQKGVAKEAYGPEVPGNALLDIPRSGRDALWDLFGAGPLGSLGAEAKIALGSGGDAAHLKSAAEKFYKIDSYKGPGGKKAKAFAPAGQVPAKRGGTKASGFIPNFAAMTISRLGGLGKSKFGLAAVINSNPYFAQLLKRYGHWNRFPPQDKAKLNKFLLKQGFTNRTLQGYGLASMHSKSIGEGIANIAAAGGYIPNFADPLSNAIGREKAAGVPVSQIRVGSHGALMNKSNPLGLGVTNTHDEPNGLRDVFGANGFVPNYAVGNLLDPLIGKKNPAVERLDGTIKNLEKNIKIYEGELKSLTKGTTKHTAVSRKLQSSEQRLNQAVEKRTSTIASSGSRTGGLMGRIQSVNRRMENSAFGRSMSGMGGMGLMMGGSMAAGFLRSEDPKDKLQNATASGLEGMSTGASVGMMFGPLGIAIGAGVGALAGFVSGLSEGEKALKEKAKAEREAARKGFVQSAMSMISGSIDPSQTLGSESGFVSELKNKKGEKAFVGKSMVEIAETLAAFTTNGRDKSNLYDKLQEKFEMKDAREILGGTSNAQKAFLAEAFSGREKEIFRGKEKLSKFGINSESATGQEIVQAIFQADGDKIKALLNAYKNDLQDNANKEKEINKAVILRLDFQKLAILAAQKAREAQMNIAESYGKVAHSLDLQSGLMNEHNTQLQKVQMKYAQAINTADQKYSTSAQSSKDQYASNILGMAKRDDVAQKLKSALAEEGLNINQGSSIQDVTEAFNKKTLDEQVSLLGKLDDATGAISKELANHKMQYEGGLKFLKKQLDYESELAETTKDVNSYYAKRNDALAMSSKILAEQNKQLSSQRTIEGFQREVAGAQRSLNFGQGYKTTSEQEAFNLNETIIASELKKQQILDSSKQKRAETLQIQRQLNSEQAKLEDLEKAKELSAANTIILADLKSKEDQRKYTLSTITNELQRINDEKDAEIAKEDTLLEITKQRTAEAIRRAEALRALEQAESQMRHDQTMRGMSREISTARENANFGIGYVSEYDRRGFELAQRRSSLGDVEAGIREGAEMEMNRLKLNTDYDQRKKEQTRLNELDSKMVSKDGLEFIPLLPKEMQEYGHLKERQKVLIETEAELARIEQRTEGQIEKEKELLFLAEQRLQKEMAHKTGPGAFGRGLGDGFERMREQAELFDYEFSQKIPNDFANALADAMSQGLSGAKDIDDALRDAGVGFLQMIQKAMMQKAAMNIVGMLPFSQGGNVRKYSQGGSVPAMVSNGEYVMSREAVNKYGGSFMHSLNSGGRIPGFNQGGKLEGFNYKSGRAYQKKKMSGFFYSQSGNVGLEQDAGMVQEALDEKRQKEEEAVAKEKERVERRNARINQIVGAVAGSLASSLISSGADWAAEKGILGKTAQNKAILKKAGVSGTAYDKLASQVGGDSATKLLTSVSDPTSANYQASRAILDQIQAAEFADFNSRYFKKKEFASGGYISGTPGIDQIPAMLSEGEYVIRASSARQIGKPMLDQINAGRFNQGGPVEAIKEDQDSSTSSGNTNNINISVNIEAGSQSSKSENSENSSSNQNDQDKSEQSFALGEKIKEQVLAVIIDEQRPGGVLS